MQEPTNEEQPSPITRFPRNKSTLFPIQIKHKNNNNKKQSTEGAEFIWISNCQKDEGCEIINQFVW
jgi:hypothetical protein